MPLLIATDKPLYWSAQAGINIYTSDVAEIGGKIGIPPTHTAISDVDSNAYLGKVAGIGGTYQPLPESGEWCEANKIYKYLTGYVICRQSHSRTTHVPADIPALFIVYRAGTGVLDWVAGEQVLVGTHRIYATIEYVCLQAHVTQADWTPPAVPALWVRYVAPSLEWNFPVTYKVNDIVTYLGLTYKCLQAHTSQAAWTPVAVPALWQKQ